MPKPSSADKLAIAGMHVPSVGLQEGWKGPFCGGRITAASRIFALYYNTAHHQAWRAPSMRHQRPARISYKADWVRAGIEASGEACLFGTQPLASIRISWISTPKGRRSKVRFPDATANPYICPLHHGCWPGHSDGILKTRLFPGRYGGQGPVRNLEPERIRDSPLPTRSNMGARLPGQGSGVSPRAGGVFSDDLIDAYIELKMKGGDSFTMTTHPIGK